MDSPTRTLSEIGFDSPYIWSYGHRDDPDREWITPRPHISVARIEQDLAIDEDDEDDGEPHVFFEVSIGEGPGRFFIEIQPGDAWRLGGMLMEMADAERRRRGWRPGDEADDQPS
jgi:hypothetical protein